MLTPGRLNNGETSGVAITKMMKAAGAPGADNQTRIRVCPVCVARGRPSQNQSRRRIYGFNAALSEFPNDRGHLAVLSNAIERTLAHPKIADRIERIAIGCRRRSNGELPRRAMFGRGVSRRWSEGLARRRLAANLVVSHDQ